MQSYLLALLLPALSLAGHSSHPCFHKVPGYVLQGGHVRRRHSDISHCLEDCLHMGRDNCRAVVSNEDGSCRVYTEDDTSRMRLVRARFHDIYQWKASCSKGVKPNEQIRKRRSVKGSYGNWQAWTACTVTCGNTGQRTRSRTCAPYGGECDGPAGEKDSCPANAPCPSYGPWTEWGACSKSCGGGTQSRTRKCNAYGGCQGPASEEKECNQQACCSQWQPWGQCSVTCGSGQQTRTRRCSAGSGGYQSKEEEETQDCTAAMATCAEWAEWGDWGPCDKTCGGGNRVKTRTCSQPGKCPGDGKMTEECNKQECPKWNPWSKWTLCTVTCNGGSKTRTRACTPAGGACDGTSDEEAQCNEQPCPEWSEWAPWGDCSATCGGGMRKRGRVCNQYNLCPGEATDQEECNDQICPDWKPWGEWGPCSATCGGGNKQRTRDCNVDNNYCVGPKLGNDPACRCEGEDSEGTNCNDHDCPSLGPWGEWVPCSATCGGGSTTRTRKCNNDATFCSGANAQDASCVCPEPAEEPGECNSMKCPNWAEWKEWGGCSETCGGGMRERKRDCDNDQQYCVGAKVSEDVCVCQPGLDHSNEQCNAHVCPKWEPWGNWGECSKPCGGGVKTRERQCSKDGTFCAGNEADASCTCSGETKAETECNGHKCATWSEWGDWGQCTKECGGGKQKRGRTCEKDGAFCASNPQDASCICEGVDEEERDCNTHVCSGWAQWGEWGTCSQNCGGGTQTRTRECTNDPLYCAGNAADPVCLCDGKAEDEVEQPCNTQTCAEWSEWGAWGECSVSCGKGDQTRKRTCKTDGSFCTGANLQNPACVCEGDDIESKPCDKGVCHQWSTWSQWSECSVVCGGGTRTRSRKCPVTGGCPGLKEDSSICNQIVCPEWGAWAQWSDCSVSCGGGERARTRTCAIEGGCSPGEPYEKDPTKCNDQVCPSWSQWAEWSACSVSCDKGQKVRNRKCEPGPGCLGRSEDVEECILVPCAKNTYWSEWAPCTKTCDLGQQTRSRLTCADPTCPVEVGKRECNPHPCPEWTAWEPWSSCSKTCGGGSRTRKRECPIVNGCVGQTIETDPDPCSAFGCTG